MAKPEKVLSMVPLLKAVEEKSLSGFPAAVGAYNVNIWPQAEGIANGLERTDAIGVIQISRGARNFVGGIEPILNMIYDAVPSNIIYAIHLDHGDEETAYDCIEKGIGSVMIDASVLQFQKNLEVSKRVIEKAHAKGISVEVELGQLGGIEEDVIGVDDVKTNYANPDETMKFMLESMADAVAPAYGTSHGAFKGRTDALNIRIPFEIYRRFKEAEKNMRYFQVSHGSSSVPPEFVELINKYGGTLKKASGVPVYMIVRGIANGLRKVNIDTDLRLAMTGIARKWIYNDHPDAYKSSERIELIKNIFDGTIEVTHGSEVIKPGEITDPRDWLKPIMKQDPRSLTRDYSETDDEPFINLMWEISETIANHVAHLNKVFGSSGLAEKVDTSMTLEKMVGFYKSEKT